jgi:hypothetical protein
VTSVGYLQGDIVGCNITAGQWACEIERHVEKTTSGSFVAYNSEYKLQGSGTVDMLQGAGTTLPKYLEAVHSYPQVQWVPLYDSRTLRKLDFAVRRQHFGLELRLPRLR